MRRNFKDSHLVSRTVQNPSLILPWMDEQTPASLASDGVAPWIDLLWGWLILVRRNLARVTSGCLHTQYVSRRGMDQIHPGAVFLHLERDPQRTAVGLSMPTLDMERVVACCNCGIDTTATNLPANDE